MKKVRRKILSVLLVFCLVISNFSLFALPAIAAPNTYNPYQYEPMNLLNQLPTVGQDVPKVLNPLSQIAPNLPQTSDQNPTPSTAPKVRNQVQAPLQGQPIHHQVDVASGYLKLHETEMSIPGIGPSLDIERNYSSNNAEIGPFGRGWTNNLHSQLRMYAEFAIGEERPDGSIKSYTFITDDPDGYVTSYDGDPMTNYELHKGHYEPSGGDTLTRISQFEYVVRLIDGSKLTYYGYYAPWRNDQSPIIGKIIKKEDRYGNALRYEYDDEARLVKIIDASDREVELTWSNKVITEIIDPLDQITKFTYDDQSRLATVTKPDNRTIQYFYDNSNRINGIKIGNDETLRYSYNDKDQVTSVYYVEGEELYYFSYSGDTHTVTNALQEEWVYQISDTTSRK